MRNPLIVALLTLAIAAAQGCRGPTACRRFAVSSSAAAPAGKIVEPWCFASETSAIVYWQTENRAESWVQYGQSARCELKTPVSAISSITGQPYWTHFHRLQGSQPRTTYFYRMVSRGSDGATAEGPPQTFQTKTYPPAFAFPSN